LWLPALLLFAGFLPCSTDPEPAAAHAEPHQSAVAASAKQILLL
jgi:hypothetical protein